MFQSTAKNINNDIDASFVSTTNNSFFCFEKNYK